MGSSTEPAANAWRQQRHGDRPAPAQMIALAARVTRGEVVEPAQVRDVVRWLLARLRQVAPGRSVEVRVPPYGAIQCVEGPRHTRGTPPNVVETDPLTFVLLAAGRLTFFDAVAAGRVSASGPRADLTSYLPLIGPAA